MKSGEILSLTGLRGIAAMLIVVTHYRRWMAVSPPAGNSWIDVWVNPASIGMTIFFTLSGYVIALSYSHWDWGNRPVFNLARLFSYRFARLYPAFLVFAVVVFLRTPTLRDLNAPELQAYLVDHLLLWQSWFPVKYAGDLAVADAFHVSWSISTECGLYVMFGVGAIIASIWLRPIMLGVAFFVAGPALLWAGWVWRDALMPAGWSSGEWSTWLYYVSPYGTAVAFGIGVLAYRLSDLVTWPRLASTLGALGIVASYLLVIKTAWPHHYLIDLPTSLSTALLMIGARSGGGVNWLLSSRPFVFVGTISYSLYLFHFLVPSPYRGWFEIFNEQAAAWHVINMVCAIVVAIFLATGIYYLVEVPGRRWIRAAADKVLGIPLPRHSIAV